MIAKVALNGPGYSIDKLYDYRIPASLETQAAVGKRVSVPFARGNRRQEGMIFQLAESSALSSLKPIDAYLDETPILSEGQLQLVRWMKTRFFCTYYQAVKAMLPAGVWLRGEASCSLLDPGNKEAAYAAAGENGDAKRLLDLLYDRGGSASGLLVEEALGSGGSAAVRLLEEAGVLKRELENRRRASDKVSSIVCLAVSGEEAMQLAEGPLKKKAPQQAELLRLLAALGEASAKELRYFTGASAASLKALERRELIRLRQQEEFRRPEFRASDRPMMDSLNAQQEKVYREARPLLQQGAAAALLYGVTGSGKTAVYIRLIRDTLELERQALVLVPEIALTPQLVSTFYQHFGDRVAVLHSSLTVTQRYDEWKRIRSGIVDVVVGTRSAVFAPLDKLGLLVIDEEQEASYQSENAPRYHARDIAKYRCVESGALLLLGSATPAVESMYEAREGKYRLLRMDRRYNAKPLPGVIIADMKQELKDGNGSCISRILLRELQLNLERGEQSILFLNRRGSSSAVNCPECGHVYECPRCSAKLTYHSANKRLMCHYCGWSQAMDKACPACGGLLNHSGLGIQKVEETLRELLGDLPLLRMDTDTVNAAHTHEDILAEFQARKAPILIGTQMVTKGLNFENVTLVGVISADQALYAGDFRAQERTFSLITQVVGRSGRGEKIGRAVIQTFTPGNEVILSAARQDYDAFYENEIQVRRLLSAPPFRSLYSVTVSGTEERAVLQCASELKHSLEQAALQFPEFRVLGPAPAGILRVNQRYRYRVILNAPPCREARALTSAALRQFGNEKRYRKLSLYGDVNPME